MISEGGPFIVFTWILRCICALSLAMRCKGNLLFFAMVRIFCHCAILLSVESGSGTQPTTFKLGGPVQTW